MNSTGPQDCRCVAIATKFQGLCGEIPSNFYQLSPIFPISNTIRHWADVGGRGEALVWACGVWKSNPQFPPVLKDPILRLDWKWVVMAPFV